MPMRGRFQWRTTLAILCLALAGTSELRAQGVEYVKAHYTKYEFQIPMRDGTKLFTAVYAPKDQSKSYPVLLTRTPYSVQPYGVDKYPRDLGPWEGFAREGYIFAYQDVRGRWMSEGQFVDMRPILAEHGKPDQIDESTDAYDTIDWLLKHVENHNNRVGMWGISYPGFYTACALVDAHPMLKAASPQAPVTDWFIGDDWHHNGAFFLPHAFNFMARFGRPRPGPTKKFDHPFDHGTPDGYQFFLKLGPLANADAGYFKGEVDFWKEIMKHGTYDDFWKSRNLRPHLKNVRPAVMTVGGWFDAENLFGALEAYRSIEKASPTTRNSLVMGPWFHGGWSRDPGEGLGHVRFNSRTSTFYQQEIELPFFERNLKGKGGPDSPEAWVFMTGKNEWRKWDAWPPKIAKPTSLYLQPKGRLGFEPPPAQSTPPQAEFEEYVSDPAKPVPFLGEIAIDMKREYMVADQRFASRRPDVITFVTEPLETDVTLAGPIQANIDVSTSGTDSDWVVKLVDVYPDDFPDLDPNPAGIKMGGFQQLVRGDVFRGKFRKSFEKPEPFVPGEPTALSFKLPDIYHCFRPGHRIMVQVQSSWFPLVDRNPQKFVDIYSAKESDFQKATQRVYVSPAHPSRLEVLTLP